MTHGTRYGYNSGCRCAPCKGANAARSRKQRAADKTRSRVKLPAFPAPGRVLPQTPVMQTSKPPAWPPAIPRQAPVTPRPPVPRPPDRTRPRAPEPPPGLTGRALQAWRESQQSLASIRTD
jgi:hypothetical protein